MKVLLFNILVFLMLYCSHGQENPLSNSFRTELEPCNVSDDEVWRCYNCTTIKLCKNGLSQHFVTCGIQFPGKNYCNVNATDISAKCVSNTNMCTGPGSQETYKCTDVGTYPSLLDCKSYFLCKKANSDGILYTCGYNSYYDHSVRYCRTNAYCYNTVLRECNKQYKIIAHRLSKSLYIICRGDESPILGTCQQGLYYNPNKLGCDFECPGEGNFVNPVDKNNASFYACVRNGLTYDKKLVTCDTNEKFDPYYLQCL